VNLLLDRNLSPSLVDRLASVGHAANHTTTVGVSSASDTSIFEWCRHNDAVLVTANKKLTKFLAAEQAADPSVVIVRGYLLDVGRLASDLVASLPAIEEIVISRGAAVFSVSPDRPIRAQLLPLASGP
jgi:predicted nuclease of predicted toxin-antitoxin system